MDATPGLLDPGDLAAVRVPVLSIVGDALDPPTAGFWHQANAVPFLEVRLDRVAHDEFTDICEYAAHIPDFPNAPKIVSGYIAALAAQSCPPPNMAAGRVHDLTDRYAVAFLERYLAGDTRYDRYLTGPPASSSDVQVTHPARGMRVDRGQPIP